MTIVVYYCNRSRDRRHEIDKQMTGYAKIEHFREKGKWYTLKRAVARAKELDCELFIPVLGNVITSVPALKLLQTVKLKINGEPFDIGAAIAEAEARNARTASLVQNTMKARSEQGTLYGAKNPNRKRPSEKSMRKFALAGAKRGSELRTTRADDHNRPLLPDMVRLREEGKSFQEIADWLSGQDLTTINGKPFSPKTVFNILTRSKGRSRA